MAASECVAACAAPCPCSHPLVRSMEEVNEYQPDESSFFHRHLLAHFPNLVPSTSSHLSAPSASNVPFRPGKPWPTGIFHLYRIGLKKNSSLFTISDEVELCRVAAWSLTADVMSQEILLEFYNYFLKNRVLHRSHLWGGGSVAAADWFVFAHVSVCTLVINTFGRWSRTK